MKKNLFLILSFLFITLLCNGQDKIIRTNGKTYECLITSIDSAKIYLKVYKNNTAYDTQVKLSDVSSYQWNGRYVSLNEIDSALVAEQNNKSNTYTPVVRENVYPNGDKRGSKNAFNIGLVGLQTSAISINYERLINSKYGLVIGIPILATNGGKETGFSISIRNHFKNTINSGYWGFFANYSYIENKVVETTNNYYTDEYWFSNSTFYIGPNIGRRWVFSSGFNIGLRIGYGISLHRNFEWIDTMDDEIMRDMTESIYKVVSGFDAEVTIGYCF